MTKESARNRKMRLMREAKERKRMERGAREEVNPLPDLRRAPEDGITQRFQPVQA